MSLPLRPSALAIRGHRVGLRLFLLALSAVLFAGAPSSAHQGETAQEPPSFTHPIPGPKYGEVFLPAGLESGLPVVVPNDNRTDAGRMEGDVRVVELEVIEADWRIESPSGPGLRVAAIAEVGGPPMIPAPVIRATAGGRIRVRLHNRLGHRVQVFGFRDRPYEGEVMDEVGPGETLDREFEAGPAGTFLYSLFEGPDPNTLEDVDFPERTQHAGALVVEEPGEPREDRLLVMNIFGEPVPSSLHPNGYLEGLGINGRSWPYTELLEMEVGREETWRVVNATVRNHPMHLHGFFFDILSRGGWGEDDRYDDEEVRTAVTESMLGFTTMKIRWTPTRPGRWLFHCHLAFHVTNRIRLPGAVEADPEHAHSHMAGLVMGIDVAPGPSDLISTGLVEREIYAREYGRWAGRKYGFDDDLEGNGSGGTDTPGPTLVFEQYQSADVTVHNTMNRPTGVHWHGLELDAWADGVPGWSASDGRMSPVIEPDESFTYRLSFLRPGTFMYHTHLDDIEQLTGGLYGAIVVLPPGEVLDESRDHVRIFGWTAPEPQGLGNFEVNGKQRLPEATTPVGESHRFRIINVAPAGRLSAWVTRSNGERQMIRLHAKDGADLPESQRVEVENLPRIGVGETADFYWTPTQPGVYTIHIGYQPDSNIAIAQRWIVTEGG